MINTTPKSILVLRFLYASNVQIVCPLHLFYSCHSAIDMPHDHHLDGLFSILNTRVILKSSRVLTDDRKAQSLTPFSSTESFLITC